jgi:hypothetical protein
MGKTEAAGQPPSAVFTLDLHASRRVGGSIVEAAGFSLTGVRGGWRVEVAVDNFLDIFAI